MPDARPDLSPLTIQERGLRYAAKRDLPPGAQAEIESRLPGSNVLAGHSRRLHIRPGFHLGLYDITVVEGAPDWGEVPGGLTVTVLLKGAGRSWVHAPGERAAARPIPYADGLTYFCFSERPVLGRICLPPRSRFQAVELRMEPDFLAGIGLLEELKVADEEHPLCHVAAGAAWVGLLPTPEPLANLATMLLNMTDTAVASDLTFEGVALDMLFICAQLIRNPPVVRRTPPRDLEALREARRLIMATPDHPWTIAMLARRVSLSEKRLKSGFRTRFNTSVNGFLQEVRLEKAYRLITEGGFGVTAAALEVGYANPSHFALMFRRRYGTTPSRVGEAARGAGQVAEVPARTP